MVIDVGGATTLLFFLLAASKSRLPSEANLFLSSAVKLFVRTFPCLTCLLIDALLPREPSMDDIESAELGIAAPLCVVAFVGVSRKGLAFTSEALVSVSVCIRGAGCFVASTRGTGGLGGGGGAV